MSDNTDPQDDDYVPFAWHCIRCEHTGVGRVAWTAFVIRAERVDGKPRQQILIRFPTIRSCCITDAGTRAAWWYAFEYNQEGWRLFIDGIDERMNRDWPACLAKLREVVPPPSRKAKAEFALFAAEFEHDKEEMQKVREQRRQDERQEREQRQADEEFRRRAAENRRSHESFRYRHNPGDSAILGVDTSATPAEVKARFRELAMVHHPDRGGNAAEFARLREAYDRILKTAWPPGV